MQKHIVPDTGNPPEPVGELRLDRLEYADIQPVRETIGNWLKTQNTVQSVSDGVLLAASEVMNNLVRHCPQPPDLLRLSLEENDGRLILDIADNGPPFANFSAKCEESLRRVLNGTLDASGRGLAMIALQQPGCRYVPAPESSDGLNHFYIPVEDQKKQKKIFVIDDNEDMRAVAARALKNEGLVFLFSDALGALSAFEREKPDLIVSDLHMPGMDGKSLRQALSAFEGGNVTPFVFISGNRIAADSFFLNELGIDDFLVKPVAQNRLRAVVRRLLLRTTQVRNGIESAFGRDVSQLLIPALPAWLNKWKTVVKSHCAEAGGGDFIFHYDADDESLFVLSDVMGKGLNAKFFACAYAGYLRSLFQLYRKERDPAALLSRFSQAIQEDPFFESTIVTCMAVRLTAGGEISLAAAGHPAPLLCTQEDTAYIKIGGPLPGIGGDRPYCVERRLLKPGDRLVLFTDGIIETRNDSDSLELIRAHLLETTLKCRHESIEYLAEKIWKNFSRLHDKGEFEDDATLVILEYGENRP